MNTFDTINATKNLLFTKIIKYLDTNGITLSYEDLEKNIHITQEEISPKSKPSIKFKKKTKTTKPSTTPTTTPCIEPSSPSTPSTPCIESSNTPSTPSIESSNTPSTPINPSKIKFKKPKKSQYKLFVDICNQNNLKYFEFTDENNWTGPAIKINEIDYQNTIKYFSNFKYTELKGTGFYIIRPIKKEYNEIIKYNTLTHILPLSTQTITSDDETDNEDELAETEIYEFRNQKYLLDTNNNDVYCINTHTIIGKRIYDEETYRDYIIEFY